MQEDAARRADLTGCRTILVEIHHPGHVHIFEELMKRGRPGMSFVVLAKDRPAVLALLAEKKIAHIPYRDLRHGRSAFRTLVDLLHSWGTVLGRIIRDRPDAVISVAGAYCSLPAFATRRRNIVLTDTETATLSHLLAFPFADAILLPEAYGRAKDRAFFLSGNRAVFYTGTQECAYLLGRTQPVAAFRAKHSIAGPLFLIRISAGEAFHESIGRRSKVVAAMARELSKRGKVAISLEKGSDPALEEWRYPFALDEYHAALAAAELVVTEGATTATEAAILGTPFVFINRNVYGTIQVARDTGLGLTAATFEEALEIVASRRADKLKENTAAFENFRRGLSNPLDLVLPPS